jgi:copper resistance protein C
MPGLNHSCFRILALVAVVAALSALVHAHAVLVESSPPQNGAVNGPNVDISLKFNVRVDAARSRLELKAPAGTARPLAVRQGTAANILLARANDLSPGKYHLIWQVLASDGHITRGETGFSVK